MINQVPDGDVLIHCGDVSNRGSQWDIADFLEWFSAFPHKHKIFIAGNHDFGLEYRKPVVQNLLEDYADRVTYLQDDEIVIDGIKFWGSPWTPEFYNWAFMYKRGEEAATCWKNIPEDVNVLITHGPPMTDTFLDFTVYDQINVGCEELAKRIEELPNLKVHCFGHIHEGYGMVEHPKGFKMINASVCTLRYQPTNKPVEIEI
jgi:Icc-related predicted phosphoesterase